MKVAVVERPTPGAESRCVDLGLRVDGKLVWVEEGIPAGEGSTLGEWKYYWDEKQRLKRVARALNRADDGGEPDSEVVVPVGYVEALMLLAEGCSKHPAYRAKREPGTNCPTCLLMWAARQRVGTFTGAVPVRRGLAGGVQAVVR